MILHSFLLIFGVCVVFICNKNKGLKLSKEDVFVCSKWRRLIRGTVEDSDDSGQL